MEITNYDKTSHLNQVVANRYMRSFRNYPEANKIIVVSYDVNIPSTMRDKFTKVGVTIEVLGYQA